VSWKVEEMEAKNGGGKLKERIVKEQRICLKKGGKMRDEQRNKEKEEFELRRK
jgi:hypothetical protein